jgi:hypothetical protein
MIIGFHGNLGDPDSSSKKTGSGATGTANSRMIRRPCVCGRTGTKCRRSKVLPSEGNEARREGCQEVAASHSSGEAGERPIRTPWSEGDAALWTGSWNHVEDTVPHQRVTAKRPNRVRDSDIPQRDEPGALTCTPGSVGAPGSNPWSDPARNPNPPPTAVSQLSTAHRQVAWDSPRGRSRIRSAFVGRSQAGSIISSSTGLVTRRSSKSWPRWSGGSASKSSWLPGAAAGGSQGCGRRGES